MFPNRLTIHNQGGILLYMQHMLYLIVLAASQRRCMINAICCIYSKIPPVDE
jgi:hypothetical protein